MSRHDDVSQRDQPIHESGRESVAERDLRVHPRAIVAEQGPAGHRDDDQVSEPGEAAPAVGGPDPGLRVPGAVGPANRRIPIRLPNRAASCSRARGSSSYPAAIASFPAGFVQISGQGPGRLGTA